MQIMMINYGLPSNKNAIKVPGSMINIFNKVMNIAIIFDQAKIFNHQCMYNESYRIR